MAGTHVVIPYAPRALQLEIHRGMDTHRFGAVVCHRRFGKTVCAVNHLMKGALTCTKPRPRFGYIAPTYTQGKTGAWDYMKYYADPIPGRGKHESELRVDFPTGGQVRIFGADNPDSLRGLYFDGVVFDEYGLQPPKIFSEVVRPMLADRGGWALFLGTPNGKNQFYQAVQKAIEDEAWFYGCYKASETGILPEAELAAARADMTQDEYDQEFECSFDASVKGAIFGAEMRKARDDGRITRVPYDPALPVDTDWDLGVGDATAIWFTQSHRAGEVRVIDYHEASGEGLSYYRTVLNEKSARYGYAYDQHWAPFDIEVREIGAGGRTRKESAADLGIHFNVVPRVSLEDGIHDARMLLAKCWFDEEKCRAGIEALQAYHWDWNTRIKEFKPVPVHDWASHGADAFRYLAVHHRDPVVKRKPVHQFDPSEKAHEQMMSEQYGYRKRPRANGGMSRGPKY